MPTDYMSYFWTYPYPFSMFLLFLLGLIRVLPVVVLAPFFGAKLIPGSAKIGFALAVTTIFLPHIVSLSGQIVQFDWYFCLLAVKELIIGTVLGFLISVPFQFASAAGVLIDHQRGSSQLTSLDPTLGNQSSPLGQLFNYTLIVIFFYINGPEYFMEGIALSFNVVPADGLLSPDFFLNKDSPFWSNIIELLQYIMTIAAQLAAPALVAIFMSDLFLGIANRLAQQVPMSFLGWALKSLAGILILWLGWYFILRQMEKQTVDYLRDYLGLLIRYASG